jgi:hypothetical protein
MLSFMPGATKQEALVMFIKVHVPPYATLVYVSLFIAPFTLHVSALLIGHLQV